MADEWVKMRALLPSDPKTLRIANFLTRHGGFRQWLGVPPENIPRAAIVGIAIAAFLKIWAVGNSRGAIEDLDCLLMHSDFSTLEEIGGVPGISEAMAVVEWAHEETIDGISAIRLPNFSEYNRPAEERLEWEKIARDKSRERQRKYRERKKSQAETCHSDVARNGNVTHAQHNAHRVEKSREDEIREDTAITADAQCIKKGVQGETVPGPNFSAGIPAQVDAGKNSSGHKKPRLQKKFADKPIPPRFISTLDTIVTILDLGERSDFLDQIGFLAKVAYADAAGFAFKLPIWDYLGRCKNKPNPAGWLTSALRGDVDAATWDEFWNEYPSPAHCQVLMRQAYEAMEAEEASEAAQ